MELNYEELLKRAREQIPERISARKRFEMPKVNSFVQGNRTIITNFASIADYLNRQKEHLLKFMSKELATSGTIEGGRAIFIGKFKNDLLQKKLEEYVNIYVKCKECGSYDTRVEKEDSIKFIKCLACQARRPMPKIKQGF